MRPAYEVLVTLPSACLPSLPALMYCKSRYSSIVSLRYEEMPGSGGWCGMMMPGAFHTHRCLKGCHHISYDAQYGNMRTSSSIPGIS